MKGHIEGSTTKLTHNGLTNSNKTDNTKEQWVFEETLININLFIELPGIDEVEDLHINESGENDSVMS